MATQTQTVPAQIAKLDRRANGQGLWGDALRRLIKNRMAVIGLLIILLNVIMAVFAPFISPRHFSTQVLNDNSVAPMWVTDVFPVMKPADSRVSLNPPRGWEVMVTNSQQVEVGELIAVRESTGVEMFAEVSGTAWVDRSVVWITQGELISQEIDRAWRVLIIDGSTVRAGAVLARHSDGREFVAPFNGIGEVTGDAVLVREPSGGYVKVVPSSTYPLGTDRLGRDLLSRIIYGSRVSLSVAVIGPMVALLFGVTIGLISGYAGGRADNLLMRVVDVMYAFPTVLFVILLMAFFRSSQQVQSAPGTIAHALFTADAAFGGMLFIFIGIGLTSWMQLARLTRGQVLSVREKEYVEAARSIGTRTGGIMWQHILPNILGPIIVAETLTIPSYISLEAFLSFIGLGVNPPTPSWGAMISEGAEALSSYPNQAIFPAFALFLIIFAFNFLGDGLRDALDPRMRGVD